MKRTDYETEKKAIDLYVSGYSVKDVGNILNINSVTVFNILKRYNVETRTKGGIYKLPSKEIVKAYRDGVLVTELAKKYNVHIKTIYNYLFAEGEHCDQIYHNKSLKRDYFHVIDSYDKAYFLGLMITDGCVLDNNAVALTLKASDAPLLEIFRIKISNENPLYYAIRKKDYLGVPKITEEATFRFKCKETQDDLAQYGVVSRKTPHSISSNIRR